MDNLQGSRIVRGNLEYGRRESDFYSTPPEATVALMRFLQERNWIERDTKFWDPACGENDMVDAVRDLGYYCMGTDIVYGDTQDFFEIDIPDIDFIITNPPFGLAVEFIHRCISIDKPFALLMKSHFYHAKSRYDLFIDNPPDFVLPLTWRPNFFFKRYIKSGSLMDMSWYVWLSSGKYKTTLYLPLRKPVL